MEKMFTQRYWVRINLFLWIFLPPGAAHVK